LFASTLACTARELRQYRSPGPRRFRRPVSRGRARAPPPQQRL